MQSEFVSIPTCVSTLAPIAISRRPWCACALALFSILGLAATAFAQARTLTVLHTFGNGNINDGAYRYGPGACLTKQTGSIPDTVID